MPNEARAMQTTASSTFDDYGAGNGPNTSGMSSNIPTTSEQPGSVQTTSNEPRTMQTAASSTFDDYRAENGPGSLRTSSSVPTTSNDTRTVQRIAPSSLFSDTSSMFDDYRTGNGPGALGTSSGVPTMLHDTGMVQTIAPLSLLSDNNAVPTGSGTATFQNVETMRTFASLSSIAHDEPGHMEDGPMPSFCLSSRAGTQQRRTGGLMGLPLHEMEQGLKRKGRATSLWPLTCYGLRTDTGDATTASQELNGLSQTTARSMKTGGVMPPLPEQVGLVYQPTEPVMMTVMPSSPHSSRQQNNESRDGCLRGHTPCDRVFAGQWVSIWFCS